MADRALALTSERLYVVHDFWLSPECEPCAEDLMTFDVTEPSRPRAIGRQRTMTRFERGTTATSDLAASGTLLYVAGPDFLRVLDMVEPTLPRELGHLASTNPDHQQTTVAVREHRLYLARQEGPLLEVDVSDPTRPRVLASTLLPGLVSDLAVDDDGLWVAALGGGVGRLPVPFGPAGPTRDGAAPRPPASTGETRPP